MSLERYRGAGDKLPAIVTKSLELFATPKRENLPGIVDSAKQIMGHLSHLAEKSDDISAEESRNQIRMLAVSLSNQINYLNLEDGIERTVDFLTILEDSKEGVVTMEHLSRTDFLDLANPAILIGIAVYNVMKESEYLPEYYRVKNDSTYNDRPIQVQTLEQGLIKDIDKYLMKALSDVFSSSKKGFETEDYQSLFSFLSKVDVRDENIKLNLVPVFSKYLMEKMLGSLVGTSLSVGSYEFLDEDSMEMIIREYALEDLSEESFADDVFEGLPAQMSDLLIAIQIVDSKLYLEVISELLKKIKLADLGMKVPKQFYELNDFSSFLLSVIMDLEISRRDEISAMVKGMVNKQMENAGLKALGSEVQEKEELAKSDAEYASAAYFSEDGFDDETSGDDTLDDDDLF